MYAIVRLRAVPISARVAGAAVRHSSAGDDRLRRDEQPPAQAPVAADAQRPGSAASRPAESPCSASAKPAIARAPALRLPAAPRDEPAVDASARSSAPRRRLRTPCASAAVGGDALRRQRRARPQRPRLARADAQRAAGDVELASCSARHRPAAPRARAARASPAARAARRRSAVGAARSGWIPASASPASHGSRRSIGLRQRPGVVGRKARALDVERDVDDLRIGLRHRQLPATRSTGVGVRAPDRRRRRRLRRRPSAPSPRPTAAPSRGRCRRS